MLLCCVLPTVHAADDYPPGPDSKALSNAVVGGANLDELYLTCGDEVYQRETNAKGVLTFRAPIKPPAPRL
jgi:gluconolactonase